MILIAVYDLKAEAYSRPFATSNRKTAERDLAEAAANPQSYLHKNPADYEAYEVGSFDERTGVITPLVPKVPIAIARPGEVK